jgi:drug/metabolite transporter (DMT)-like permease
MTSPSNAPPPASRLHLRGVLLMLGSAACFVANVLLIRGVASVEEVNVWLICNARFLVGLALVAVVYRREWQPRHLVRNPKLAERGFIGGLTVVGFYATVVHLGPGRATFINNTYVIWGALLAVVLLREHLRPLLAAGSVIALAGLGLLTGAFARGATVSGYDALGIGTAIASGYIVVTIRQLHRTEHSSTIFSAQCAYGLLICGVPALWHLQALQPLTWMLLAVAGICAAGGQLMMTLSFRHLSVAEGSLLQMIVPLGIAVGDALLFAEHFTRAELIGGALILAGCALPAFKR